MRTGVGKESTAGVKQMFWGTGNEGGGRTHGTRESESVLRGRVGTATRGARQG